jgi:hypothetical protein
MGGIITYFSPDYATGRARFREMALRAGGRVESLPIGAAGPQGEALSIDTASFGPVAATRAVVHSSGLHGVEGFAGSAIQLQLLNSIPALPHDTALILTHVLNPFGMAWLRRVNEQNVDLNRNCLEGEPYSGAPPTYAQCDGFLNPPSAPRADFYLLKAQFLIMRYGKTALKQAVAEGQYEFPRGLFFGGKSFQSGPAQWRSFLPRALPHVERVISIDVHTGVGKYGEDLLLVDAPHFEHMRGMFGDRVSPLEPDRGPAYRVRGGLQNLIFGVFPRADVSFLGQEFGTYSPVKMTHALREENRWHHFGTGDPQHRTKRRLKEVFCPDDERWRRNVLDRGDQLIGRALNSLRSSASLR